MKKPTCSDLIITVLERHNIGVFLAIHEISAKIKEMGYCHSETAISARLRELAREGKVEGCSKEGASYKLWGLTIKSDPRIENWGYVKQEGSLF